MKDDEQIKLALITSDGYTYEGECRKYEDGSTGISLDGMKQVPTLVLPHAYPDFLEKMFTPEIIIPFDFNKVEYVQIHTCKPFRSSTTEVWFE